MKIRKLETEEKQNTKKLYEEVFSEDSKSFVDYYYEEKLKDNQIYAVEEDGEIQAMLHLNPYELAVNGSKKDGIISSPLQRENLTGNVDIWQDC